MIRPAALIFAVAALAGPAAAATLELRDVSGKVVVLPENRTDIAVTILRTDSRYPISVSSFGDRTIIAGHAHDPVSRWFYPRVSVCGMGPGIGHWLGDLKPFTAAEPFGGQPEILVRTPMDVKVDASGDSNGAIAHAHSVDLSLTGCGDWVVGNVAGDLSIEAAGSSDVRTGAAGRMELRLQGSGDVATRAVANGLDAQINGSGDVSSASASGPVQVRVSGSGDVAIDGGSSPHLDVGVYGSGDVAYDGVVRDLDAVVAGSGDVHVAKVTGRANTSTPGSGDVDIGH